MIFATLDSVTINSLERGLPSQPNSANHYITGLDLHIKNGAIVISMDPDLNLIEIWKNEAASTEFVNSLVNTWNDLKGFNIVPTIQTIPFNHMNALRNLGFNDTTDKFLLRLSYSGPLLRLVVSKDSDFWHPTATNKRAYLGDANAPVAKYVEEYLDIHVSLLPDLIKALEK
ncbi:hypothetical protein ACFL6Q_00530 [Candidatus Neomarinimicrobiota bacterium]